MSDDIADFLRRAAQRRRPPTPPAEIEILDAEVLDAEILDAGKPSGDDLAQHVKQHLDTSSFAERASHLGEAVDQSDDRLEAHLHNVFEHNLGQLGARTGLAEESTLDDDEAPAAAAGEEAGRTPAGTLQDMLRDPQNLRNAIILSEIFKRPEDCW